MKIQYKGLHDFDSSETSKIKEIVTLNCEKLDRKLLPNASFVVHAKKHDKEGTRCKYSFVFRLEDPNFDLNAECSDWELPRALHAGMKKILVGFNKKYRVGSKAQKQQVSKKQSLFSRILRFGRK
ncbi:MAG: hypothetical protein Q8R00_01385 [Candidatus Nanoarchaeia archaeon]|nr:hypothetical protein [Candidatus Nanoarchaeia archaeon]